MNEIFLAVMTVGSLALTLQPFLSKLAGYVIAADITLSFIVFSSFLSTGTVSGLSIAVYAVLFMSLGLRVYRSLVGCERYFIDGKDDFVYVATRFALYGVSWVKAILASLGSNKPFVPPPSLKGQWKTV
jgi:hypothetical protein